MNATREETDAMPGTVSMRASATWFLDQDTLPRHESAKLYHRDLKAFAEHLIPKVEQLARGPAQGRRARAGGHGRSW
ncbi:DUF6415 family natural product biosynthesis protein [Streptomyces sp. UG1]|uniref:DUF6415 family natural product biosynthesis protein n=1 Tax=Streptomyces sp. UG1 TaxID=3417652 RepID=UPI003CEA60F3